MPLVTLKIYERRLNEESEAKLIDELTQAVCNVFGDEIREHTWVLLEGMSPSRWGMGGNGGS